MSFLLREAFIRLWNGPRKACRNWTGGEVGEWYVAQVREPRAQPGDVSDIYWGRRNFCFLKEEISLSHSTANSVLAKDGVTSIAPKWPSGYSLKKTKQNTAPDGQHSARCLKQGVPSAGNKARG